MTKKRILQHLTSEPPNVRILLYIRNEKNKTANFAKCLKEGNNLRITTFFLHFLKIKITKKNKK